MKKLTWHPIAVGAAVLLAGCSAEAINALLAATQAAGPNGIGPNGQITGDGGFTGKWYACGMASRYVDLTVDGKGQISGKVVDSGTSIYEVRGTVRIDGKATVEFVPMTQFARGMKSDNVEVVGTVLRGIRAEDGTPVVLQRTIDPDVTSCAGTGGPGGSSPDPYFYHSPNPYDSGYYYHSPDPYQTGYYRSPDPYQTGYHSPDPYQTDYHSPDPYRTGYYYSPTPYQTGYYYSPTPYPTGHYSPSPYQTGYYSPSPYQTGSYYSPDPNGSGGAYPQSSPLPFNYVSESTVVGDWQMCGYAPDYIKIYSASSASNGLMPFRAWIANEAVATGYAKLYEESGTGHAMMAIFYDPVEGNHWVARSGDLTYYVHPESMRQAPGSSGPGFFTRHPFAGSSRCIVSEFGR